MKFYILFLINLYSATLVSQSFFKSSEYSYSFNGDLVVGATNIKALDSLTVSNIDTTVFFQRTRMIKFFDSDVVEERTLPNVAIRTNGHQAFIKFQPEGRERILYNFNLAVGDTYTIFTNDVFLPGSDSMNVKIISYGDSLIDSQVVPYQKVEYTFDISPNIITDHLFLGIGSLSRYIDIFDIFSNQIGGGQGGPLVCYTNANTTFINESLSDSQLNELSTQCTITSSTLGPRLNSLSMYPNPTNSTLTVETKQALHDLNVSVFSTAGKEMPINRSLRSSKKLILDLSQLSPGLYYVRIGGIVKTIIKT